VLNELLKHMHIWYQ